MLNQDVHSVTPGGTWRVDMEENQKNRGLEWKTKSERKKTQEPELREGRWGAGAGLTWLGDVDQNQGKARWRKSAGMGYKL